MHISDGLPNIIRLFSNLVSSIQFRTTASGVTREVLERIAESVLRTKQPQQMHVELQGYSFVSAGYLNRNEGEKKGQTIFSSHKVSLHSGDTTKLCFHLRRGGLPRDERKILLGNFKRDGRRPWISSSKMVGPLCMGVCGLHI